MLQSVWRIGSIYTSTNDPTSPAVVLGFGTWVAMENRVLVGKAAAGTFSVAGATGGAVTHTLSTGEMPVHGWSQTIHGQENGTDVASMSVPGGTLLGTTIARYGNHPTYAASSSRQQPGASWGSGQAHNNLQPYRVVYMWERTA